MRTTGPNFVPLVLFEDPDVLSLPIARLKRVHLLNIVGWLRTLQREGVVPEAGQLIDLINAGRKTPMLPVDRPARTKKLHST